MNDIVGKQKHLKERHIGDPVLCWDFAQGVVVQQFPDILLDSGSFGIEAPDPPWMRFQIGDHDVVGISSVFEEGQLLSFYRIFGDRPSHDDKPMRMFPLERFVLKLSYLEAVPKLSESTLPSTRLDSRVLPRNDRIATTAVVEKLDDSLAEKTGVATNADTRTGNLFGNFFQTELQKRDYSSTGTSVSGSQRPVPKLLQMRLEAKEGMIGSPAVLLGIVANSRKLQFAVYGENHGIEIEGQSSSGFRQRKQTGAQLIVQRDKTANGLCGKPLQKATQCGLVWKAGKTQQGAKGTVVLQDFGLVDASQPGHDGKQQCQNYIGRKISDIALRNTHILLNQPSESELLAKTLQKHHPSEVSEVSLGKLQMQCSQGFRHGIRRFGSLFCSVAQTVLKVRFVPQAGNSLENRKILYNS